MPEIMQPSFHKHKNTHVGPHSHTKLSKHIHLYSNKQTTHELTHSHKKRQPNSRAHKRPPTRKSCFTQNDKNTNKDADINEKTRKTDTEHAHTHIYIIIHKKTNTHACTHT